jgi:hypothetical protein
MHEQSTGCNNHVLRRLAAFRIDSNSKLSIFAQMVSV